MRKVSLILFLFACFALLTVPANIALADDIEKLERKLEYLKAKQVLDLELEILTAKIQKLEDDYSDVIEPEPVTEMSSSEEKVTGQEENTGAPSEVVDSPEETLADELITLNSGSYDVCGKVITSHHMVTLDKNNDTFLVKSLSPYQSEYHPELSIDKKGRYAFEFQTKHKRVKLTISGWVDGDIGEIQVQLPRNNCGGKAKLVLAK